MRNVKNTWVGRDYFVSGKADKPLCPRCGEVSDRNDFGDVLCQKCWDKRDNIELIMRIFLFLGVLFSFLIAPCLAWMFFSKGNIIAGTIMCLIGGFFITVFVVKILIDIFLECDKAKWFPWFWWA